MSEFNVNQLDQAQVSNTELVPDISQMLNHIAVRKSTKRIGIKALAKHGDIVDEPMENYLKKSPHIGSSSLKDIFKSPLSFYHAIMNPEVKEKKSFELGSFIHQAFLEPDLFEQVVVEPDAPMNTTDGVQKLIEFWTGKLFSTRPDAKVVLESANLKVAKDGFDLEKMQGKKLYLYLLRESCGLAAITEENKMIIDFVKKQYLIYGGGIIPEILKNSAREYSFYGSHPDTGLPVKVRPDAFNIEENIGVNAIISMKSTSAQTLDKFMYDTAKFKYELSEGMYQHAVSSITGRMFNVTIMIMIQTVPPFSPAVFWWSPEDIAAGKYKYNHSMSLVKDCYDKGVFSGFDVFAERGNSGIIEMHQPEWAHKIISPAETEL